MHGLLQDQSVSIVQVNDCIWMKFSDNLRTDVLESAHEERFSLYTIRQIFEDNVSERIPPVWGLNQEGEINGCFRELGTPGLWNIMGKSTVGLTAIVVTHPQHNVAPRKFGR